MKTLTTIIPHTIALGFREPALASVTGSRRAQDRPLKSKGRAAYGSWLSGCALVALAGWAALSCELMAQHQATGFKIGEVTSTSAIIWTRLTAKPERNPENGPMVEVRYAGGENRRRVFEGLVFPDGATVNDLRDAVPGTVGETRALLRRHSTRGWRETQWKAVDPERDFTRQIIVDQLRPGTRYDLRVEGRGLGQAHLTSVMEGTFRTAPAADSPDRVVFAVSTGQAYRDVDGPHGFDLYAGILTLEPDFFVHTGDIVYYDSLAKNAALARYHWQRTYSLPTNVEFHRQVASYFIKDDHDTWVNDCWPTMRTPFMGDLTFDQGLAIFTEQVPMGPSTIRTYRWGRDLQVWLVEGRDFRGPNPMPDGPGKTIWGSAQKAWFKRTVRESDATFRVLISPTPVVGPDRINKNDNHSNKGFTHEGDELRAFLAEQKNMIVVCGDRHWQYFSVHPDTGVREYSCGPASDKHAGGWRQSDWRPDYHRFLKVAGGFLSGTAERINGEPTLTMRFHAVDGSLRFEDRLR